MEGAPGEEARYRVDPARRRFQHEQLRLSRSGVEYGGEQIAPVAQFAHQAEYKRKQCWSPKGWSIDQNKSFQNVLVGRTQCRKPLPDSDSVAQNPITRDMIANTTRLQG